MEQHDLELLLAEAIEGMAATQRQLAVLASSVVAIRAALLELHGAKWEILYAKYCNGGPESALIRQQCETDIAQLLQSVRRLKQSS
jgi:hypothetical protein